MNKRVKIVATLGPAVEIRGGKNYGEDGYTLVLKNGCLSVNADGGDTDEC